MTFELWPAVVAGVVGCVVMMVARLLLRAAGMPLRMDVTRIWGTLLGVHGAGERPVGVLVHLLVSGGVALVYAWGFDLVGADGALSWWGLLGGFVHWLVAGLMMTVLPVCIRRFPSSERSLVRSSRTSGGLTSWRS